MTFSAAVCTISELIRLTTAGGLSEPSTGEGLIFNQRCSLLEIHINVYVEAHNLPCGCGSSTLPDVYIVHELQAVVIEAEATCLCTLFTAFPSL